MNDSESVEIIRKIAETPVAPLQESAVTKVLHECLKSLGIAFETDKFGNTVARVRKGMPRRTVAFLTALDRPALRVVKVGEASVQVVAEGVIPAAGFQSAKLVFPRTKVGVQHARVSEFLSESDRVLEATVQVSSKDDAPSPEDFATFDLDRFKHENNRLCGLGVGSAACAAALVAMLVDLTRGNGAVDVYGVFTRAYHKHQSGALAVAIDFAPPRDTLLFGLDTENQRPEGQGPWILSGDLNGPFDPRATAVLRASAEAIEAAEFAYRRGRVANDSCLPSVFLPFGFSAAALALPVENRFNAGAQGIVTEELSVHDVQRTTQLCTAAAVRASSGGDDLDQRRNALILASNQAREKLRSPIDPLTGYPSGARF